jgi:hypothetical protein
MGKTFSQSQQAVPVPALNLPGKIIPKFFKKPLATGRVFDTFPVPFRLKSLMVSAVAGR